MSLNICLISQEYPPETNWGGVGIYMSTLATEFARLGHRVTVIARASPGAPATYSPAPRIILHRVGVPIGRKRLIGRTLDRMLHANAVAKIVRFLDAQNHFDVIETTEANLDGEVLLRDDGFKKRVIIQCNGSNAFGQVPAGLLAPLHRADWAWSFSREQKTLQAVPHIVVTSEATQAVVTAQHVPVCKLRLIYQGIDTNLFVPPQERGGSGPLAVGFVGRLEPRKGIDFIWRIAEALGPAAGVRFHLKGAIHPMARAEIQDRFAQFGEMVVHHQPSGHDEMPPFYRGLDVLLQPSRFENFGLAYAEAMATGLLVIAGIGGSAREIVRHGETGFLVDPDGPIDEVIDLLRRFEADRSAFDLIRLAARADVESRFSLSACVDAKLELYREIAKCESL